MKCNYTYKGRTRKYNYYYYCGGREQRPVSVCDAPQFKGRDVDRVVWEWLVSLIKNPKALLDGLQGTKQESAQENQILIDRLEIIEKKIEDQDKQLAKLLDLYLAGEFPRELLTERKTRLEENLASLRKEHQELQDMIENVILSESQMEEIQKFCDGIRDRVDIASFEEKRQLLELLDVRGKLAVENDEKVVHVTCLIKLQPVSLARTSHWRCNHKGTQYLVAATLIIPAYGGY
jgi:hypothetical protein